MELADDYSWSLVGSKTDKYLWILSRTPSLDTNTLEHILRLAANRGYDTSKILWVEQN
jgi:lipocalin